MTEPTLREVITEIQINQRMIMKHMGLTSNVAFLKQKPKILNYFNNPDDLNESKCNKNLSVWFCISQCKADKIYKSIYDFLN